MAAYVITDGEIIDADLYGQFLEKVTATVEGMAASLSPGAALLM